MQSCCQPKHENGDLNSSALWGVGGWVGWYERNESLSLKGEEKWIWRRVNWCCLLMVMRSHYLERGSHFFYIVGTLRQPENPLVIFKWNLIDFNKHLMEFLWNSNLMEFIDGDVCHITLSVDHISFLWMDQMSQGWFQLFWYFILLRKIFDGDFCKNVKSWWKKFPMVQVSKGSLVWLEAQIESNRSLERRWECANIFIHRRGDEMVHNYNEEIKSPK